MAGYGLARGHRRGSSASRASVRRTKSPFPAQVSKRVILLDEDLPEDQHQLLRRWRLRVRRIGAGVGRLGMKDRAILALLHSLNRPTLFTLDHGFFKRRFCHQGYGLVYLDVEEKEAADFLRRTLRHPQLKARSKRMGTVVRVRPALHSGQMQKVVLKKPKRPRRVQSRAMTPPIYTSVHDNREAGEVPQAQLVGRIRLFLAGGADDQAGGQMINPFGLPGLLSSVN
jgi:hypothetical protein